MKPVLVVLINYLRTANLPRIVQAVLGQSAPCKLVIVDNHPPERPDCELPSGLAAVADDVWRFGRNEGPRCRFAPALFRRDCRYVCFLDDDLVPGPQAVEHLLKTAQSLNDQFATIGEMGRRFDRHADRYGYRPEDVPRGNVPTPVDLTCRAHFVRIDLVHHLLALRWDMLTRYADTGFGDLIDTHDDILLCLGIQRATGYPCYTTPLGTDDTRLVAEELPDPHAVHRMPHHRIVRSRLIRRCWQVGWKSVLRDDAKRGDA
jgi:hypothetical protein